VTEGMGPATISAESNVPPELLCVGEDPSLCNIFATVQTNQPEQLTCPNSDEEVPQLTFPVLEDFPGMLGGSWRALLICLAYFLSVVFVCLCYFFMGIKWQLLC